MEETPIQPFEDPELKAALRRVLPDARETVPEGLRARIASMAQAAQVGEECAGDPGAPPPAQTPRPVAGKIGATPKSPWRRWGMAAIVVIGFGGLAFRVWEMNQPTPYDKAIAIPTTFYEAMRTAHARRAAGEAGPDQVTTLASAGPTLSKQLNRGVFVPDLSGEGWTFQGAAIRKMGAHEAAQLFYTKGEQSLSAVSLPTSAMRDSAEGARYDTVVSGTPIAGFVKGSGLFCIIGSSDISVEDVKQMLVKHEAEIVRS